MPTRPPVHGAARRQREVKAKAQAYDARRGTAASRGYDSRWKKARDGFLRKHPLCAECQEEGRVTAANVVDHIIPHKGDETLFWQRSNWRQLCTPHHNRKTAREDGGFGNLPRNRTENANGSQHATEAEHIVKKT